MRIGIDATCVLRPERTGVAHYVRCLVDGLAFVAGGADDFTLAYRVSRFKHRAWQLPLPDRRFRRRWFQGRMGPRGLHVAHGPDGRLLGLGRASRVVTVHDVFALDPGAEGRPGWLEKMRLRYAAVAEGADQVICLSEWTKRRFLEHHAAVEEARVHVVPPGVEARFTPNALQDLAPLRTRLDIEGPYVLFLGALVERKNPGPLIDAWAHLGPDAPTLVLAGSEAGYGDVLRRRAAQAGVAARVRFASHLDTADLPPLLAGATCLVLPSRAEGFGLPVLEAQASGTPVVHSGRAALPEASGGIHVEVDPDEPASIAAGVRSLWEDSALAERLRREGLEHAARFDWRETARRTLEIYRAAAA